MSTTKKYENQSDVNQKFLAEYRKTSGLQDEEDCMEPPSLSKAEEKKRF